MITTSEEQYNRQRSFEIAVVVSFLLHFLLGLLLVRSWPALTKITPPRDEIAAVRTIRIDRRVIPPPPAPKPRVVVAQPKPQPVHPDPVIPALPVPQALQAPPRPQVHQRSEVTHIALHAPPRPHEVAGAPKRSVAHLDQAQLSALQSEFKATISQAQAQSQAQESASRSIVADAAAPKHYAMSFSGIHDNLRHGEGTIDGCKNQPRGKYNYHYYCHYEYMYADGHVEEDTIPWPQIYPADNDPLMAMHSRVNILPPPAEYKPDRPLQPLLRMFFTGEAPPP